MAERKYDSTVTRIAGNIAGSYLNRFNYTLSLPEVAQYSVRLARLIVAEVKATEEAASGS